MTTQQSEFKQDRDWLLRVKLMMPERLYRAATRPAAALLRRTPDGVKYRLGLRRRRRRYPYCVIEEGDCVMQVGAPSDLLAVGRSRAAYFLHLVGATGKVIVLEPDTINCEALEAFAARHGMGERLLVVSKGGWSEERVLKFFQSREHPASAVLEELNAVPAKDMARRGYTSIEVPVTTVDKVLQGTPQPKLISLTTNGAELQILEGMADTLRSGPPYMSLAITGDNYPEALRRYGYEHIADDDRGFTFRRR